MTKVVPTHSSSIFHFSKYVYLVFSICSHTHGGVYYYDVIVLIHKVIMTCSDVNSTKLGAMFMFASCEIHQSLVLLGFRLCPAVWFHSIFCLPGHLFPPPPAFLFFFLFFSFFFLFLNTLFFLLLSFFLSPLHLGWC